MVKAKATSKPKSKAKNTLGSSASKKTLAAKMSMIPCCVGCGEFIDDDTKAVQCETCVSSETWKCAGCLDLTDEMYYHLATSSKSNFHWFCEKCEATALGADPCSNDKILSQINGLHSKTDNIEHHLIDNLAKIEQKLLDRVKAMEEMLQKKTENDLLQLVEGRLRKLEDKPVVLEEVQQRLEHKVDQLRSNMDEPVALAVQGALQEDKSEELEIERRKTNVIVHGVPESVAEDTEQRIDDDLTVLAAMFQEAKAENIKVENVVRLGKKATDPMQHPRPMKVVLDSAESKISLLKKAKNLREAQEGGWSKVFIHQDLTPKQREARKPLVAELKERKANGEKDLIIYNGKVVKKRGH